MALFVCILFQANALTYSVTVPTGTNACYLAGEMNDWTHQPMTKVDETHFKLELATAVNTQKYKYCSGPSWGYVEKTANGWDIENRKYSPNDEVKSWSAVYDQNKPDGQVTYQVTVPKGTNTCFIIGGWDGWREAKEMTKIDDTHYTLTFWSNKLYLYNYAAGPGTGYLEMDPVKRKGLDNRHYAESDVVARWASIYDNAHPDADLTYTVTVPAGTKSCFLAGGWDGWQQLVEMKKVNATTFTVTFKSNIAQKYIYLSGNNWKLMEMKANVNEPNVRIYSKKDVIENWNTLNLPK